MLCISNSKRMLVHAFAWSKTIKNIQKWLEKYFFHHAHERLTRGLRRKMKKNEENSLLVSDWEWLLKAGWHLKAGCSFGIFIIFLCFWSFSTMRTHAQACIRWSKYTTVIPLSHTHFVVPIAILKFPAKEKLV